MAAFVLGKGRQRLLWESKQGREAGHGSAAPGVCRFHMAIAWQIQSSKLAHAAGVVKSVNPLCRKFMPRNAFGFGRAGEVFASSPARAAARRQGNGPYQGWARSRAHPIDSPLLWKRALSAEAEPCKKSGRPDRYRMAWSRSRFCCFAQERYGNLRRLTGSPW